MADHPGSGAEAPASLLQPGVRQVSRRVWRLVLGLALGLVLLALAARGVDLDQAWASLTRADPLWVGLSLLAVLSTTAAKVGRWRGLFPGSERPGLSLSTRALLVGQLVNALLPARLGEVARAFLIGKGGKISKAGALGTIAAEKAFDVLFLLICAGLTSRLASLPSWLDVSLAGMAALGISIFGLAVVLPQGVILAWAERWAAALPPDIGERLEGVLRRGLAGLTALRRPRMVLLASAWSTAAWTLAAGTNYLLFRAFDLGLSVGAALLLLTLLHAGMAPPSSPGRLGVFHALTLVGLQAFDVDRASGLAYATVLHALVYGPQILFGALALGLDRGMERRGQ